jgi:uncharacterized membrane protein YidH (DUF202 family)
MFFAFRLLVAAFILHSSATAEQCTSDSDCELLYKPGSKCIDSGTTCSNPFASGCLHRFNIETYGDNETGNDDRNHQDGSMMMKKNSIRVCNNDDATNDYCQVSPFNYTEIRVHNGNWESSILYSWIIQIFLMEFLQVPVRVGLASDTVASSFYNLDSPMFWSSQAYAFDEIETANRLDGHCELTDEPCVHVMPEVWIGQEKKWKAALTDGNIDRVDGDGQVGKVSWYVPTFTVKRHPQVASFHGLSDHREELARIFKRPTTWLDYCEQVSTNNCSLPDDFSERHPMEEERTQYFAEGYYTGHFRNTLQNNCTANPDTCTGHIVAPDCGWSTNVEAQAYWNDIALESNGNVRVAGGNGVYSYEEMIRIWRAANATSSDVIMWWWTPDATVEEFRGTEFEFQQVLLPEPTAECRAASINSEARCSEDPVVRWGDPAGACDNESNALQRVTAKSLQYMTMATRKVDRSPGNRAIHNLKVNQLDINVMLKKWVVGGRTGYAARDAVCDWVLEHKEELQGAIPSGYPRMIQDDSNYGTHILHIAQAVGCIAVLYVLVVSSLVYKWRQTKVFVYVQVSFIFMILFGLLLVALGSIFFALEPENPVCVSQMWLTILGYTLELVPCLVRVAAINRLMQATKRMRRVQIRPRSLFATVAILVLLVAVFLTIWTVVDAPKRVEDRFLIEDSDMVMTSVSCTSETYVWELVALCWEGLLIVCATVLAFQSRHVKQEFNDSRGLGTMVYSHFVFAILRAVTFNLQHSDNIDENTIPPPTIAAVMSFLLSLDVITSMSIYILPKLEAARKAPNPHRGGTYSVPSIVVREIEAKANAAFSTYQQSLIKGSVAPHPVSRAGMAASGPSTAVHTSMHSISEDESINDYTDANPASTHSSSNNNNNSEDDSVYEDREGPRFPYRSSIARIKSHSPSEIEPIEEGLEDLEKSDSSRLHQ